MRSLSLAYPRSTITAAALIFSACVAPASATPATSPQLMRFPTSRACGTATMPSVLTRLPSFVRMIAAQCLRTQPRSLSARVATSEKETVLHSFGVGSDGASPPFGPVASRGKLYGTTYLGGTHVDQYGVTAGTVYEDSGSTENVIYNFTGGADGDHPGQLVAADDALYGITGIGGDQSCGFQSSGCGTVFKLTRAGTGWKERTIYTFTAGSAGQYPGGIAVAGGVVYVAATGAPGVSPGTIIALTPPARGQTAWSESTLYTFGSSDSFPYNIIAAGDSLYGFTSSGAGAVFKLTPSKAQTTQWTETTLHVFGGTEGALGGSLIAAGGALYGTALFGGIGYAPSCPNNPYCGNGTVFALTPPSAPGKGWNEQTLYEFTNGADGSGPNGTIAVGCALIGTTTGANGTVFKLSPPTANRKTWLERTLYTFGGSPDGATPDAQLLPWAPGTLYGTTGAGGSTNNGTIFELRGADIEAASRCRI